MEPGNAHQPEWYVVSLRPRGEHDALRRAALACGAVLIELSPWTLQARDDDTTRYALDRALDADVVIATSIAAVRAAAGLRSLHEARARWVSVGSGTAQALGDAGVRGIDMPRVRMDSEGVLALPVLHAPGVRRVGLLTAPGGRDVLHPSLHARGLEVARADVYDRIDIALDPAALEAIRRLEAPAVLAVSSSGALQRTWSLLDAELRGRLQAMQALAASARIAATLRTQGFSDIAIAASARPDDLLAVARRPG